MEILETKKSIEFMLSLDLLASKSLLTDPHCYLMIGKPGSGKTTLRNQIYDLYTSMSVEPWISHSDTFCWVSSDDIIEHIAQFVGMTYSDVFKHAASCAQNLLNMQVANCLKNKHSFIWDQTNLTAASRALKIKQIRDAGFNVIGVTAYCNTNVQRERVKSRPGKEIPDAVLDDMDAKFEWPNFREGFDYMIYKDTN